MATKTVTTGGRRAGKTTAQKEAIAQANAKGQTVAVDGPDGVTVHEPGRKPRKVSGTTSANTSAQKPAAKNGKENGTAARKTGSKASAKGKAATKVVAPPVEPASNPKQGEKRSVGRPSVYRDEYCDLLIQFFRIDLERQVEVVKQDKDGKAVTVTETVVNRFPTLTRFADSIDVTRQTLHDWATAVESDGATLKHPEFSYAYTRAKDLQESLLIEGGMSGVYDPRFAVMSAKNLIGWRDQIEQTVNATVTQTTVDELDKVYEEGMAAAAAGRSEVARRRAERTGGQGE